MASFYHQNVVRGLYCKANFSNGLFITKGEDILILLVKCLLSLPAKKAAEKSNKEGNWQLA